MILLYRSDGGQLAFALRTQQLQLLLPLLLELAREVHLAPVVLGQAVRVAELEGAVPAGCPQHARPSLATEAPPFHLLHCVRVLFVSPLQGLWLGLTQGQLAFGRHSLHTSLGEPERALFYGRLSHFGRLVAELKRDAFFLVLLLFLL